ncbi:MAG TPA: aspartate ammonia-lyase [Rhodocyclaceae bacterium]|nr:aspartate ammonia-lyase [Rhodocyclaceae bacterium]
MTATTRLEHDLIGEEPVPADAYWGIHTLRAIENYPISGKAIGSYSELVRALALVKQAAALAHKELGQLDATRADAIVAACQEIAGGKLHDQFVVDVIQGGAGTSTNMNANEVIANRALELLGRKKGEYDYLHPINHVNMSQSTNDVYPTALRVATCFAIRGLLSAMAGLRVAFEDKADEFKDILKIGRTQLQDAVPMTLGQEFSTYAVMLGEDEMRLAEAIALIREINLGATAIGTGINTDYRYAKLAIQHLSALTGLPLESAPNLIEATQDCGSFVQLSGVLKRIACKLSKTCNDLRLLSSGPQAGFNEIRLPPRAAGSSIMPGKVNPVIPEVVNQIAFEVIGNDMTITMAAEGGQLQLNAFEPIIAHSLFKSVEHLAAGCRTLAINCVRGISANRELLAERVRTSASLATALNPYIGYENATRVAQAALQQGKGVAELVTEMGLMKADELEAVLRPDVLTAPGRM